MVSAYVNKPLIESLLQVFYKCRLGRVIFQQDKILDSDPVPYMQILLHDVSSSLSVRTSGYDDSRW
jgi:hypothetical protein